MIGNTIDEKINEFENYLGTLDVHGRGLANIVDGDFKGDLNHAVFVTEIVCERKLRLPIDEIINLYFKEKKDGLDYIYKTEYNDLTRSFFDNQCVARMYKAICGTLTDLHGTLYFQKELGEDLVKRDTLTDRMGVDLSINYPNNFPNLYPHPYIPYLGHIYIDNQRSLDYRENKKINKASNNMNGIHIDIPYKLCDPKYNSKYRDPANLPIHACIILPNKFGIFNMKYVKHIVNKIKNGTYLKETLELENTELTQEDLLI